ncbi:glycosyltransferase [Stenotrophomonas maltophilia]|uniref:glycosyltransferase n=1 Tax=Stenotrophomonas sepilia TaxID=2860290 RepID=UPI00320B7A0E
MSCQLSAIITFHREGILAHATLRSYLLSKERAREAGVNMELVLVLDNADAETTRIVCGHPALAGNELIIETTVGDSALARNVGVDRCSGAFVCTLDGDDLISRDYFQRHVEYSAGMAENAVLHPEMVVSFGMYNAFNWQIDQRGQYYSRESLLLINPWISAVFARRNVFSEIPYLACYPGTTGFGYEDWYWNCETTAAGYEHLVVPGTAYFYRRKFSGSVNETSKALQVVMPPSKLFDFEGLS